MTDANLIMEQDLADFSGVTAVYAYPENSEREFPVASYYNITSKGVFAADNDVVAELLIEAVDVWAKSPSECGQIGLNLIEHLTAKGWYLAYARDVPETERGVYHRHLRFEKLAI